MNMETLFWTALYVGASSAWFFIGRMTIRAGTSYLDGYRKGTDDTISALKKLLLKHTNTDTQ